MTFDTTDFSILVASEETTSHGEVDNNPAVQQSLESTELVDSKTLYDTNQEEQQEIDTIDNPVSVIDGATFDDIAIPSHEVQESSQIAPKGKEPHKTSFLSVPSSFVEDISVPDAPAESQQDDYDDLYEGLMQENLATNTEQVGLILTNVSAIVDEMPDSKASIDPIDQFVGEDENVSSSVGQDAPIDSSTPPLPEASEAVSESAFSDAAATIESPNGNHIADELAPASQFETVAEVVPVPAPGELTNDDDEEVTQGTLEVEITPAQVNTISEDSANPLVAEIALETGSVLAEQQPEEFHILPSEEDAISSPIESSNGPDVNVDDTGSTHSQTDTGSHELESSTQRSIQHETEISRPMTMDERMDISLTFQQSSITDVADCKSVKDLPSIITNDSIIDKKNAFGVRSEGEEDNSQEGSSSSTTNRVTIDPLVTTYLMSDLHSQAVEDRRSRILAQSKRNSDALLANILDPKVVTEDQLPSLEDILSKHTGKSLETPNSIPFMTLDKVSARRRSSTITSLSGSPTEEIPHPANLLRIAASTGKSTRAHRRASIVSSTPVEARMTYSTADTLGGVTTKQPPISPSLAASSFKLDLSIGGANGRSWEATSPLSHRIDHRKIIVLKRSIPEGDEDNNEGPNDFHDRGVLSPTILHGEQSPLNSMSSGNGSLDSTKAKNAPHGRTKGGFSATNDSQTSKYLSYERTLGKRKTDDASNTTRSTRNATSRSVTRKSSTDTTRRATGQTSPKMESRSIGSMSADLGIVGRMSTRNATTRTTSQASPQSNTKTTGGKIQTRPEFPDRGLETLKNLTQTVGGSTAKPLSKDPAYAQLGEHSTLAKSIVGPIYEAVGLAKPEMNVLATSTPNPSYPVSAMSAQPQFPPADSQMYQYPNSFGQPHEAAYYNYGQLPASNSGSVPFQGMNATSQMYPSQVLNGYPQYGQGGPYFPPQPSHLGQQHFYYQGGNNYPSQDHFQHPELMAFPQMMHGTHPMGPPVYPSDGPGPYAQPQSKQANMPNNEPTSVLPTHFGMFPNEAFSAASYGLNPKESEAEFDKVQSKLNKLRDKQAKRLNYEQLQRTYAPHQSHH